MPGNNNLQQFQVFTFLDLLPSCEQTKTILFQSAASSLANSGHQALFCGLAHISYMICILYSMGMYGVYIYIILNQHNCGSANSYVELYMQIFHNVHTNHTTSIYLDHPQPLSVRH